MPLFFSSARTSSHPKPFPRHVKNTRAYFHMKGVDSASQVLLQLLDFAVALLAASQINFLLVRLSSLEEWPVLGNVTVVFHFMYKV